MNGLQRPRLAQIAAKIAAKGTVRTVVHGTTVIVHAQTWQPITGDSNGYTLTAEECVPGSVKTAAIEEPDAEMQELLSQIIWTPEGAAIQVSNAPKENQKAVESPATDGQAKS